jgi:hypothetical protein
MTDPLTPGCQGQGGPGAEEPHPSVVPARRALDAIGVILVTGLVVCIGMVSMSAQSQDGPEVQPGGALEKQKTHRFWDGLNVTLTVAEATALLADGVTTQRALRQYPGRLIEGDPIARVFVSHGWAGQIAGGAVFLAADAGLRYWLHRRGHHTIERWIPSALIVYGINGAAHNTRVLRRLHAEVPR